MSAGRRCVDYAETEPVLLNVTVHGKTHHVEGLVRKYRRVIEVEELSRETRQHRSALVCRSTPSVEALDS